MKKILCILMSVLVFITSTTLLAAASTLAVISPAEGDVSDGSIGEIVFTAPEGQKVAVYLDGEIIADIVSEGENRVDISDRELYLGDHTVKILTYGEGTPLCAEANFSVKKEVEVTVLEDFNDSYINENITIATSGSRIVGKDADGNQVQFTEGSTTDKDGNKNGAKGFRLDSECTLTVESGTDYHVIQGKKGLGKEFTVEYDLLLYGTAGEFELETRGQVGTKVNWGYLGGAHAFKKGGIVGSGTYTPGEWMHVKHIVNSENGNNSMYIDDAEVYNNTSQSTQFGGISQIKFQYFISDGSANQGYAVDNFKMGMKQEYTGIEKVSYHMGDGEYTEGNVISKDSKGLKLSFMPKLAADKKIAEKIHIFENGKEKKLESVSIKNGDVLVELSKGFMPQSEVKIVYEGEEFTAQKKVTTDYVGLNVRNITFTANGNKLYGGKQINEGDTINVFAQIKNLTSEKQDFLIVAVLYKEGAASAISVKRANLSGAAMTTASKHSFDITAENGGDKIELYIANMQNNACPMSKIWKLD